MNIAGYAQQEAASAAEVLVRSAETLRTELAAHRARGGDSGLARAAEATLDAANDLLLAYEVLRAAEVIEAN